MPTENSNPYILAVSCFYHDSAACLVQDGKIAAAAQEERRHVGEEVALHHPQTATALQLVEQGDRKAVLKIDAALRVEPYNSRPAEASIQSIAAGHGLANAVLYVDNFTLLTEYVEGTVWEPDCLERDRNIELVAEALRRLHSLPRARLSGRPFLRLLVPCRNLPPAFRWTRTVQAFRLLLRLAFSRTRR